ncbi:hypothetical protein C8R42DRAFT_723598 [Lentinula raphanica]|nr:hypothetical protein C8R42DRAFT_723598 [Lentinula raphanica]
MEITAPLPLEDQAQIQTVEGRGDETQSPESDTQSSIEGTTWRLKKSFNALSLFSCPPDPLMDSREVLDLKPTATNPFHNRVIVRDHRSIFHQAMSLDGCNFDDPKWTKNEERVAGKTLLNPIHHGPNSIFQCSHRFHIVIHTITAASSRPKHPSSSTSSLTLPSQWPNDPNSYCALSTRFVGLAQPRRRMDRVTCMHTSITVADGRSGWLAISNGGGGNGTSSVLVTIGSGWSLLLRRGDVEQSRWRIYLWSLNALTDRKNTVPTNETAAYLNFNSLFAELIVSSRSDILKHSTAHPRNSHSHCGQWSSSLLPTPTQRHWSNPRSNVKLNRRSRPIKKLNDQSSEQSESHESSMPSHLSTPHNGFATVDEFVEGTYEGKDVSLLTAGSANKLHR